MRHKLQHLWHEVYYRLVPKEGVDFAMNCKDVTARIDLGDNPNGLVGRFRFWLHLSLCKACKGYLDLTLALRRAARAGLQSAGTSVSLEKLNKSLLQKHAKN